MKNKKLLRILKTLLIISTGSFASISYAVTDNNGWHVEVAPYLWAMNMNGTVQSGTTRMHIDESFSDILQELNFAGMLWVDASKGKFGVFGNIIYAVLSKDVKDGALSLDSQTKFGLFSAGISYEVYKRYFYCFSKTDPSSLGVEPYAGFRYTLNDTTITAKALPLINARLTNNQHWTDPIIGAKLRYTLNKAWSAVLAGDIGGTNASDHYSYNVVGLIGYHPQTRLKNTTWYLGYRLLDQHYEIGSGAKFFNWNMKLFGPILGVAIAL